MARLRLKDPSIARSVTEIGPGDFVHVGSAAGWIRVASNTAHGADRTPRRWTVRTVTGLELDMYSIGRYALASDLVEE